MKHWPTELLGEVATCLDSQRIPVKEDDRQKRPGSVPYYGANGQVGWIDKAIFNEPLLLVAEDGGHFDEPERGVAYTVCGPSWVNNHAHALRPDESKVLLEFLGYHFRHFDFQPYITGTTRAKLTQRDLMRVEVPVPPLAEQERIVKLLDEADELRKLRAQADRRTATLIPSLFHEMFGSPAINEFGWPVECVGTLFNVKRGGAKCGPFGSALKKHECVESGIPVWGIPNVLPNQFVEAGSLFISPSKFEELRAYAVEPGDLLFSRAGTVGRICVANPKNNESIIGTNLVRLALDLKRVVPEFFATLMTHFGAEVGRLRANADEGAYSFMNTTILKALRIYLPPFKLQEEFAARVSEIRALQVEQTASRCRLEHLFQSLLHRAFQGEL